MGWTTLSFGLWVLEYHCHYYQQSHVTSTLQLSNHLSFFHTPPRFVYRNSPQTACVAKNVLHAVQIRETLGCPIRNVAKHTALASQVIIMEKRHSIPPNITPLIGNAIPLTTSAMHDSVS